MRVTLSRLFALVALSCLASFGMARAQNAVVVELFTSQGCSSCPPADKLLGELAKRDNVIALAMHVDYWDYLGWKDTFASPENTKRQRQYAAKGKRRSIFTPEAIIMGEDSLVGHSKRKIEASLKAHGAAARSVEVAAKAGSGVIAIAVRSYGDNVAISRILLASIMPHSEVEILRGENRGKSIYYHNIVTDLAEVAVWDGKGETRFNARMGQGEPYAVLVQDAVTGKILNAVKVR